MAKTRPHTDLSNTAMPTAGERSQPGDYPRGGLGGRDRSRSPAALSGEVRTQSGSTDMQRRRSDGGPTGVERGVNPSISGNRERNPPGGTQKGLTIDSVYSAMTTVPDVIPVGPERPGRAINSATMNARSSVPASIQEGPNTRDRFGSLSYGDNDQRFDNAELDDGTGTGRRARGAFRGGRRM